MPFRGPALLLEDVASSIDNILVFVAGMTFEQYCADLKTRSSVERQLQIMTEAAKRLGPDAERLCPGHDWRGFRGMGDILRHAYENINNELIWTTIHHELPPLRQSVANALAAL